ncbi:MAG: TonB-dependent receptor [Sphingobium sp.]|nr:TonB-dependent receptor [Sphingobium sp.]
MASGGFSRRLRRQSLSRACFVIFCLGAEGAAHAKCSQIDIAPGPLDRALLLLAGQAGLDVASTDSRLGEARGNAVSGCLSPDEALRRLTRGTGFRPVRTGQGSYRLVRAPQRPQSPPVVVQAPPAPEQRPEIVVTGTKQQVALLRFPGMVHIITGDVLPSEGERRMSLDDLAQQTPIMQKTELGVGRNKLFIRGISDSSFNGPTQATATIYYGDVQLNYSGPQPAINLVDMERVEVLEGPQETLYGAGAISGIIRLTPRTPDLDDYRAAASAGATLTKGGAPGYDASLMANLPLIADKVGLRLVGYHLRDGGFIDDTLRGLNNVDRTETIGGRAALRVEPGDGWSIDSGVLAQRIEAADANYAETIVGPLARRAFLAQPYDSNILLARAVIRKRWDSGLQMTSATGLVKTRTSDTFDATRAYFSFVPLIYQVDDDGLLLSHEMRFSRTTDRGWSWVAGVALLYDREAQSRIIGQPSMPIEIIGVTNIARSASLFGEATVPVTRSFWVTVGARASIARTVGEPSITPREAPSEPGFLLRRVEPAIAMSWVFAPRMAMFARFQSGYRTGGIAVARGLGRIANFRSDAIKVGEVGLRMERSGARGLAFSSAFSYAHWGDIQADLFSRRAQPYTDNIGDGDIIAVEASGDWIPTPALRLDFAALWTSNRTQGALSVTSPPHNRHLPDTPPFSGNIGLNYRLEFGSKRSFEFGGNLRYVGRSVLGSGDFLDVSQGDYLTTRLSGALRWGAIETTITVENLTNERNSQFAMGNPLTFGFREQVVPLRPRNIRFGLGMSW